jgi:hypothetical protein
VTVSIFFVTDFSKMTVNDLKVTLCTSTGFWGGEEANSKASHLSGVPLVSTPSMQLPLHNPTTHPPSFPFYPSNRGTKRKKRKRNEERISGRKMERK